MRRTTNLLTAFSIALFLLASAAITGCSARVRIDDPDHDVNHFNSSEHSQEYSPQPGR